MSISKTFAQKGVSYWLRNKMYLSLTNVCNSTTLLALRGPTFKMPEFKLLEPGFNPTAEDILQAVDAAFDEDLIGITSMESDEITFAGCGEPLLRKDVIYEAAGLIKDKRHGVPLRVRTNGLISSRECSKVAEDLKNSGIDFVSVALQCDNPKQYLDIMKPTGGVAFPDVCSFIVACVEADLTVNCMAVKIPGVDIPSVRSLSESLGAHSFTSYSYYP